MNFFQVLWRTPEIELATETDGFDLEKVHLEEESLRKRKQEELQTWV